MRGSQHRANECPAPTLYASECRDKEAARTLAAACDKESLAETKIIGDTIALRESELEVVDAATNALTIGDGATAISKDTVIADDKKDVGSGEGAAGGKEQADAVPLSV